jgi:hypothetical protein
LIVEEKNLQTIALMTYFDSLNLYFIFYLNSQNKKGYTEHIISTSSEWILAIMLMMFLFTFLKDFNRFKIKHPTVIVDDNIEN